ncbi:S-adenosyl-L-methionine-dependent methyltransferase [Aspergillus germanicus]
MTVQSKPIIENSRLQTAHSAVSKEACMGRYDEWAPSYNKGVSDVSQVYVAPRLVAQIALRFLENEDENNPVSILDAGCGTGLVGQSLAALSKDTSRGLLPTIEIDGADLSASMLKVARSTGVHRALTTVDLTQPIDRADNSYDIVTCCGTFTHGHVSPDTALRELVRVVKPGGLVVATIVHDIWAPESSFEVTGIAMDGLARVVSAEIEDYRRGAGDKAVFLVLREAASSHTTS